MKDLLKLVHSLDDQVLQKNRSTLKALKLLLMVLRVHNLTLNGLECPPECL